MGTIHIFLDPATGLSAEAADVTLHTVASADMPAALARAEDGDIAIVAASDTARTVLVQAIRRSPAFTVDVMTTAPDAITGPEVALGTDAIVHGSGNAALTTALSLARARL